MKILITGSYGLIGNAIYQALAKLGHNVVGFDRSDKFPNPDKEIDMIIHCAANCIIRDVIKDPTLMKENIDLTYNIMKLAKHSDCKKVILFSSSRLNYDFENPYTVSKKFLENIAKAYQTCYGIDYLIIRPETVWGERDNSIRVIPNWIKSAIHHKPLVIYGNTTKELCPVYIGDFVKSFLDFFKNFDDYKNREPIVITGESVKAVDIAKMIIDLTKSRSRIVFQDAELTQPQKVKIVEGEVRLKNNFKKRLREVLLRVNCPPINEVGLSLNSGEKSK